jgi:hypothetical protein
MRRKAHKQLRGSKEIDCRDYLSIQLDFWSCFSATRENLARFVHFSTVRKRAIRRCSRASCHCDLIALTLVNLTVC